MTNPLKMPDAAAGAGVEGEYAVGEKVVADAVGSIEIEKMRSRWRRRPCEFRIDAQAGPGIGASETL